MQVAIVQLMPMMDQRKLTSIALLNSKLQRLSADSYEIITTKEKCSGHLKSQLLQADGYTMTSTAGTILSEALTEQLVVVKSTKTQKATHTVNTVDDDVQEVVFIPEESVGLIIGNKGGNIRSLQSKSGAQISIINFIIQWLPTAPCTVFRTPDKTSKVLVSAAKPLDKISALVAPSITCTFDGPTH